MSNKKDISFFENKHVLKTFESTCKKDYNTKEVINSFWKKYSYIKAVRNVYDVTILLKGEDSHGAMTQELEPFMKDLMSLLVAYYYAHFEQVDKEELEIK
jgi:hypothetical protein